MNEWSTKIYTSSDTLPNDLLTANLFHSPRLFGLCKQTPRHKPYMVAVSSASGAVVAQLLALVRYRSSWFPPYFYMHCRIYGEGAYTEEGARQKDELFGLMLDALTRHIGRRVLYVEVSNLSQKMFGYKQFRQSGYFPVRWMSIHNSLHSRTPEERITPRQQQRIDDAYAKGVTTTQVETEEDFSAVLKLLHRHNWLKPKRYVPSDEFFKGLQQDDGRLFVTKYHGHVVGCSVVVYSEGQAYLWYAAYRRKSFVWLHPADATIWHAIKDAHRRGYEHIFFIDVGLPFRKNPFRDFILRFGGKPVSSYRWFRISIKWVNSLGSWFFRE